MKDDLINDIRSFNRFYTNILGLHDKYLLKSNYMLVEVRIMFEINVKTTITASVLNSILQFDKGYLSRILKKLEKQGLIHRVNSKDDRRYSIIKLTEQGNQEFKILNQAANSQIMALTKELSEAEILELVNHMNSIRTILITNNVL